MTHLWDRDYWRTHIASLDPRQDREEISRIVAMHEFPWDVQQALSFALFRTYAVPSIGRLLYDTGAFVTDAQKRHDDTVLLLEGVLENGMEAPDGRAAVRRMNQMHGSYDISNDDMRYVLSTFVVTPVRWISSYGYRPLDRAEIQASVEYYRRLGALMGITDVPTDFETFSDLMDDYEAANFAYDPKCRAVADATLTLLTTFYPRPLAPVIDVFSRCLMDDHVLDAFGYDRPRRWAVRLSRASVRLRGRAAGLLPPRMKPARARDLARIRSYPHGFLIERLGTFPATKPHDI